MLIACDYSPPQDILQRDDSLELIDGEVISSDYVEGGYFVVFIVHTTHTTAPHTHSSNWKPSTLGVARLQNTYFRNITNYMGVQG